MIEYWEQWQVDIAVIGSLLTFLTCISISAALVVFWLDKRRGLPYANVLLIIAAWVMLCGIAKLVGVINLYYPVATLMAIITIARATLGLYVAVVVWPGVNELRKFAPPKQMQCTLRTMSHMIADLSEGQSNNGTVARNTSQPSCSLGDGTSSVFRHSYSILHSTSPSAPSLQGG